MCLWRSTVQIIAPRSPTLIKEPEGLHNAMNQTRSRHELTSNILISTDCSLFQLTVALGDRTYLYKRKQLLLLQKAEFLQQEDACFLHAYISGAYLKFHSVWGFFLMYLFGLVIYKYNTWNMSNLEQTIDCPTKKV